MRFNLLLAMLALLLSTGLVGAASAEGQAKIYPQPSHAVPIPGDRAPDFTLTDVDGGSHRLSNYLDEGKVVVLEWLSPDCPFTQKFHEDANFMGQTEDVFHDQPVVWLGIDSSAAGQPGSSRQDIRQFMSDYAITAPVLLDRGGSVGRAYGVRSTPTMVVIAANGSLIYRGAPDASTEFDRQPQGKNYVKAAVEAALIDELPRFPETSTYGCDVNYAVPRLTAGADTARF
jgi:peroxiredoxin